MLNSSRVPSNIVYLQIQDEDELSGSPLHLSDADQGLYMPLTNFSSSIAHYYRHKLGKFIWTLDPTTMCLEYLALTAGEDIMCICGDASFATFVCTDNSAFRETMDMVSSFKLQSIYSTRC